MQEQIRPIASASGDRHVAVDGCLLHVRTVGVASRLPTVVLEAGGGSPLETWALVAQQLAPHLRVFSYERAGVGSSEGRGASCAEVARRLSLLLEAEQITQPVILAGHSLGGLYSRYFAATHPERVAGLVLVDTTPDDLILPGYLVRLSIALSWAVHAVARSGLLRLPAEPAAGDVKQDMQAAGFKALRRVGHVRAVQAEIQGVPRTQRDVAALGPPKNLPVLCVSAGKGSRLRPSALGAMQRSHDRLALAGAPPWSRHHSLPGSTHMSLLTDERYAMVLGQLILEFAGHFSQPAP